MTKKVQRYKIYVMVPPKIAESDILSLVHGLFESSGSISNTESSQNTLSTLMLTLTMIDPATGWFEIVKATNKSATSILIS
jgi:hypothetical protein